MLCNVYFSVKTNIPKQMQNWTLEKKILRLIPGANFIHSADILL